MGFRKYSKSCEKAIESFVNCFKNKVETSIRLERINTGSYVYFIDIKYDNINGINYYINKHHISGKFLGTIKIDNVSLNSIDYRTTSLGRLPNSVINIIINSFKDIMRISSITY